MNDRGDIVWVCRDGRKLRVADMTTEHLHNAQRMKRVAALHFKELNILSCYIISAPEGAGAAAESEVSTYVDAYVGAAAWLTIFKRELDRRAQSGVREAGY